MASNERLEPRPLPITVTGLKGAQGAQVCPAHHLGEGREREGSVYVRADRNYYGDRVIEIIMGRRW